MNKTDDLREEVAKKLSELLKNKNLKELEMKFDEGTGAKLKATIKSESAIFSSFYFNEEGEVESFSATLPLPDLDAKFPEQLSALYENSSNVDESGPEVIGDGEGDLET